MWSSWSDSGRSKIQRQETAVRPHGTKVATQTYHIQVSVCVCVMSYIMYSTGNTGKTWPLIRHIKGDFDKMGGHHANRVIMLGVHCLHTCTHPRHVHGIHAHLTAIFNASAKMAAMKESDYCSLMLQPQLFSHTWTWSFRVTSLASSLPNCKMNVMLRFKQHLFIYFPNCSLGFAYFSVVYKLCHASLFRHANSQ